MAGPNGFIAAVTGQAHEVPFVGQRTDSVPAAKENIITHVFHDNNNNNNNNKQEHAPPQTRQDSRQRLDMFLDNSQCSHSMSAPTPYSPGSHLPLLEMNESLPNATQTRNAFCDLKAEVMKKK
ncbi:hypothetical protein IAQ61_007309 [Plenodomus lingam]|uniref:Predicted protein n=1 Tax=Leptosphaeria maculans (strain JN3 / isolate v23.1.3 / race Av1-4-5-6-7-8) TaxID=985895 RepID=E5A0Y2_LEPMJ|nr:predicted protein [Plenodomus lingam JN3]KAH9868002.1 hypothetical protein IAQ61_007309 [Plenodomus lingam]CBX97278.1 predicted protein [Plenodomus lingam JN3]